MKLPSVKFVFFIYILMLTSFVIGTLIIGGDAAKKENGKYYVYGYSPIDGLKKYREVTQSIYTYSLIHLYVLLFVTFILAIVIIRYRATEYINRKIEKKSTNKTI